MGSGSDDLPVLVPSDNPRELGRLAHFRVLECLGAGGMGVVYRANDTKLQRSVALKLLRPRIARDPAARARFLGEARAVASIKHEHVVVVHEAGEGLSGDPETGSEFAIPYLAMELLDGVSLQTWMRQHPRPPIRTIVRLGRQTAEALAALHARGLIHRDVKPGNLWLEKSRHDDGEVPVDPFEFGKLKLLDFGLAATSNDVLRDARALGTPAYMAPEQDRGESVDARCDLFSLGCVLYELCTAESPFPACRFGTHREVPLLAHDINVNVPAALGDLIAGLLREDASERPESARRVVQELTRIEQSPAVAAAGSAVSGSRSRSAAWIAVVTMAGVAALVFALLRFPAAPVPVERPLAPSPSVAQQKVPIEEIWYSEIRKLPAEAQFRIVTKKLEELNSGYDARKAEGWVEPEAVIRFNEHTEHLHDIRPLACLIDLKSVVLWGAGPETGQLTDLTPLRSLRLNKLNVSGNPHLHDLSPIKGMPLFFLNVSDTAVASLADAADSPLKDLRAARTPLTDLGPVRSLPQLRVLDCQGCPIANLEPLVGSSIEELMIDYRPTRDAEVLKGLASLRKINGMPADEFRKKHDLLK
jgi:eukaryotic-like serine/threonine-protein kinase